ncbi:MAG: PTS fructose transporter subunit IIA [Deltaproteobacteria bacterium HGW-Deltaproteobacteria-7]|jgi:PTS system mannose-specific IIA component|nr:MAG: PTS fructose transporter subunit IIA [Deltaproteobacteria bacterium HGW-Deltaproteobacteria-7]PKN50777.1 MAG: PTS fructose transporter subunit IIA [Deltaproteobacteria bacterium HGW-Deltaproteobacteria-13]
MIGTLITTHGNLGDELIKSAELIKGPLEDILHICIDQTKNVEDLKKEISNAIKKLDKGRGVLILTDLFGGTPSNISLSFIKEDKVEVLTGVNLPMMLKLSEAKQDMTLREFACLIKNYGEKNIMLASEILSKKAKGN